MSVEILAGKIVNWMKDCVKDAGADGIVVGLSGGIDSSVVAALAKRAFPENSLGVIMPCHSNPIDEEHARILADTINIETKKAVLDTAYDELLRIYGAGEDTPRLALANIKPRLRMITLYFFANSRNYIVAGTGNKSELIVGYFTKYGDGGVDILPIGGLVKTQVRELATYLGVPQVIIDKPPTAGLWDNQTDEKEMGITYEELDRYILTGLARPEVRAKIDAMNKRSEHKRRMARVFEE
ncbi:MAG: NAD(+) synthase [Thermoanaerobacteraceae bacterium]|nr:NAD(+) synthase [Thermoanaerobacteraceae bacterium]